MAKTPQPPDFSKWILKRHESLWLNPKTESFERRPIHRTDSQNPFWAGHVTFYQDKTGLGKGCEYNIFGQDVVLKLWGLELKDRQRYDSFMILASGAWRYFNGSRYFPAMQGIKQKKDLSDAPFSAVCIYVENPKTEQSIFELIIPRDLLLLPPAQK